MKIPHPKILYIVGYKKSGKTTLLEFLVSEFTRRGLRAGTFKHSSHHHPVDKPGSDSDRLRQAGAQPSVFGTISGTGIYYDSLPDEKANALLEFVYRECDIVLAESFREADGPKILINPDEKSLQELKHVIACVGDKKTSGGCPVFLPGDIRLADFLIRYFRLEEKSGQSRI